MKHNAVSSVHALRWVNSGIYKDINLEDNDNACSDVISMWDIIMLL